MFFWSMNSCYQVQDLLTGNTYFAGGFTGGFLIGLAS